MITESRDTSFYYDADGSLADVTVGSPFMNNDPAFYYEFKTTESVGFDIYDYGLEGHDARFATPGSSNTQWLFDEGAQRLHIDVLDYYYTILTLTQTELYIYSTRTFVNGSGKVRDVDYQRFERLP